MELFVVFLFITMVSVGCLVAFENVDFFLRLFEGLFKKESHVRTFPHINDFGRELIKELDGLHSNIFVSPYSINWALLIAAVGSSGDTFSEFVKVLHIPNIHDFQSIISNEEIIQSNHGKKPFISANSVWINMASDINKTYIDSVEKTFDSSVFPSNFSSSLPVTKMNLWVSLKTNGLIRNIIESIDKEEVMIIINTLYYKGKWKTPFKSKKTHEGFFYREDNSKILTRYMSIIQKFDYFFDDNVAAAVLPFTGGPKLLVILPHKSGGDVLSQVIDTYLTHDKIQLILSSARFEQLDLEMPRFDVSYSIPLKRPLRNLGLKRAFEDGAAEFPHISATPSFLGEVHHQAVFSINEDGAKAAAVTVVSRRSTGGPNSRLTRAPIAFHVRQPFVFVLLDGETALFMGVIRDVQSG